MCLGDDFIVNFCVPLPSILFPSLLRTEIIMIDLFQVFFFTCDGPAIEHVGDVYMPKGDDRSLLVSLPGRDVGTGLAGGTCPLTS